MQPFTHDDGSLTRRSLLGAGMAAAFGMSAEVLWAEEKSPLAGIHQAFDKVEPQKFPWGWIRWVMNSQIDPDAEMTMGIVQIEPNQSNPLHIHPNSAEFLHVLSGSCEHRLGGKWLKLKTGDTLRIPKGVPHSARTKDESCRVLVVYNTGERKMVPVKEGKEDR